MRWWEIFNPLLLLCGVSVQHVAAAGTQLSQLRVVVAILMAFVQHEERCKPWHRYQMTPWVLGLNEVTPDLARVLPPTDTRLRADIRALELGQYDQVQCPHSHLYVIAAQQCSLHSCFETSACHDGLSAAVYFTAVSWPVLFSTDADAATVSTPMGDNLKPSCVSCMTGFHAGNRTSQARAGQPSEGK